MPEVRIGFPGFFEHGLDDIRYASNTDASGLPAQGRLPPAEANTAPLAQLLSLPNIASFLDEAVRPVIDDRTELSPERYREALQATQAELDRMASEMQSSDPESAKIINRAARVLREDAGLRELLRMYRSALHQG